jgi:C4-dicarboxylate-specific signal transduction histidine kinase
VARPIPRRFSFDCRIENRALSADLGGIHTAPAPKRRRLVRGKNGQIVEHCLCRFEIGSRAFLPYKPGYDPPRFGKSLARRTNPSAESQNRDAGWTCHRRAHDGHPAWAHHRSGHERDGYHRYYGAGASAGKLQRVQAEFAHAARLSMLGELTASIAHEVNQPLTGIVTTGQVGLRLLNGPEPDLAEMRELTKSVVDDALRAADIIVRVRAMATRQAPEQTLLSLDEAIREALTFLRHEVQSHGLTVTHHTSHATPKVLADRTQIQQVIVNLTVNAIQAMAHAERPQRTLVIRTTLSDPHTLCCTFEDSGPGIKPEHLDFLFDSFFTTKDAGMGLGLPLCRSIIEAHGGHIRADNDSACGGARFSFTLPAKLH